MKIRSKNKKFEALRKIRKPIPPRGKIIPPKKGVYDRKKDNIDQET